MQIYSTYKVKIKHYNHIFKNTVAVYRNAVDYLIAICMDKWDAVVTFKGQTRLTYIESLIHAAKEHPNPVYDFDTKFYKMPSYLRRGAINEAIGKITSYRSSLANRESNPNGKKPSYPTGEGLYP